MLTALKSILKSQSDFALGEACSGSWLAGSGWGGLDKAVSFFLSFLLSVG